MANLAELQKTLGHAFRDVDLLRLALTHPSVAHAAAVPTQHNQRLEFLGDSVLNLVLSRLLFEKFPAANEGQLTKSRARLVNAKSLADHAGRLGLGAHLILSRGEESSGGRTRSSAQADAFEAVIGALYLDGGFDVVREFIIRGFDSDLTALTMPEAIINPKGELQELLQAKSSAAPVYALVSAEGPDHDRHFTCAVIHNGVELARGSGKSKKTAESAAAFAALEAMASLKHLSETTGSDPSPA